MEKYENRFYLNPVTGDIIDNGVAVTLERPWSVHDADPKYPPCPLWVMGEVIQARINGWPMPVRWPMPVSAQVLQAALDRLEAEG